MNTAFDYLYRDGDNYKNGGRIVLVSAFTPEQEARLREALSEGSYFIASQIDVPEVFLWNEDADYNPEDESTFPANLGAGEYVIKDADHCWHEWDNALELTEDDATDTRTVEQFVADVEKAHSDGWKEFTPTKHR